MAMKAIPRPPIQFSIPRQRFMPAGSSFSPRMTVAPVVVIPETLSKKACSSVRRGAPRTKGKAPKKGTSIQIPAVSR